MSNPTQDILAKARFNSDGLIPAIVLVFLIRKIGEMKAKHLLLSGELVQGNEAMSFGLVNYLAAKDKLDESVFLFAQKLIKNNSSHSMTLTKQMIDQVQSMSLTDALAFAAKMNAEARGSDDCRKGIDAFLNKQDLIW